MPAQFASCPCCGMSAPFRAFNFEADGSRVQEPVVYGTFVKTRFGGGGKQGLHWETIPMPEALLHGLRAQLVAALAFVDSQLGAST